MAVDEADFRGRLGAFYATVPRPGTDLGERLSAFLAGNFAEVETDRPVPMRWSEAAIRRMVEAFDDLEVRPRHVLVVDDVAYVAWMATGLHRARFLSYPATGRRVSFSGFDVVQRTADGDFRRHAGWLDAEGLHAALQPAAAAATEPVRPVASRAVEQAVLRAGEALANVSQATDNTEFGWRAELDVPRWTLTQKKDWGWVPGVALAALAALLGAGLLGLLWEEISDTELQSETRSTALAIGGWTAVLVLAFVAWRSVSAWRSLSRVQMDIRRTMPTRVEVHRTVAAAETEDGQPAEEVTTRTAEQPAPATPPAGAPAPTSGSVVQKEPVLLGSALVGGGSLALGIAGNLEGGEVAAVTAGALAISALFIREVVSPIVRDRQDD